MDKKLLRCFFFACCSITAMANVSFAQAHANPQPGGTTLQKVAIGIGVWLATAVFAYVAWTLLKVIAKIGVFVLPIVAGIAVAMLLPDKVTSDAVLAVGVPWVTSAVAATLVCYLYANFYDIERELGKLEAERRVRGGTPPPPTVGA
jgi:hypothetical protein